jgi:Na+/alanine symporter
MESILTQLEHIVASTSDVIWPIFLPFILLVGAFTGLKTIFVVKNQATEESKLNIKNIVGPASISLGAMIGMGSVIGMLGALSKYSASGEIKVEAIAIWALIGSCIMVPVSYAETLNSKLMKKTPKEYIGELINPKLGMVYAICFVAMSAFGYSGFQFSGINSVAAITSAKFGFELSQLQRYFFIVLPLIAAIAVLVLSKKHEIFMNAMTYMIGTAIVLYFTFFMIFVFKTADHIPVYLSNMIEGMLNPVNGISGMILGFVLGMQKVILAAETGLGALAMAAQEADTKPREAALISLIPTLVTVFVAIIITTYIASYGLNVAGTMDFANSNEVQRLNQLFATAKYVVGGFGEFVLTMFTILSALTTILGAYYYMGKLFKNNSVNKNIAIYLTLITISGTLAVFGANVVFEAADLLLFVLSGLNVTALAIFTINKWKAYKLDSKDSNRKVS